MEGISTFLLIPVLRSNFFEIRNHIRLYPTISYHVTYRTVITCRFVRAKECAKKSFMRHYHRLDESVENYCSKKNIDDEEIMWGNKNNARRLQIREPVSDDSLIVTDFGKRNMIRCLPGSEKPMLDLKVKRGRE